MALLRYRYSLVSTFASSVVNHAFKLRVTPMLSARQRLLQSCVQVSPLCALHTAVDGFGNSLHFGFLADSHAVFSVDCQGIVEVSDVGVPSLSLDEIFLVPTSLTEADDTIRSLAKTADVEAIMHAVHSWLEYRPSVTDNATSAIDVSRLRMGVCQDYAHLMVAACRSCGLPARYVNGLMVGEGTTHAWVEVLVDGSWQGFDPTLSRRITTEYIKFAHGRDVGDCPTNRGSFCGWTTETMSVESAVSYIPANDDAKLDF